MEESKSEIASNVSDLECDKEISLYDWISSDNKISLDDIYELCKSRLSKVLFLAQDGEFQLKILNLPLNYVEFKCISSLRRKLCLL